MTESYNARLLSADSHIVEPADLWLMRMDKKWRDKAPRIAALDETGDYIVIDGLRPRPLAFEGPMADLKAQDLDSVAGEIIYPGVGLTLVRAPDADYLYACCRAYNDWLAEYCQPYPDRLKGVGMIPCRGPMEWAVAETERC